MSTAKTEKFISPEELILTDLGPCLHDRGVTYRVWAKGHASVVVHVEKKRGEKYAINLEQAKDSGYFFGIDASGVSGDRYQISIDGAGPVPDLVSHYQPLGAFGPSEIVDAAQFRWQATEWKRPAWTGQVVYECHLGTFTSQGTYRSTIERLDYLVDLGVTALELMPVADWAGERNWGYDGVLLFAPAHAYGTPNDFRALIDACHQRGLAVILDVVFNHLGPEGNFSHDYSAFYFHEAKGNPWGQCFNLDGPNSEPVRSLLRQNIRYWLDEFRIDGFRMDATHMVHDPSPVHLLAEIADIVHDRGGFIIAEDDRNSRHLMEPREKNGWNFDALWSDDYHHAIRVSQTGEQQYFLSMFHGGGEEIGKIISEGWLYSGQYSPFHKAARGTPAGDFAPERFVFCISNHDQVGNRINGIRLHETISPPAYRAISLFHCLVPYTPLLFMGQEWGAGTPFHYFTDLSQQLADSIAESRKNDYLMMGFATDRSQLDSVLNPHDEKAFTESKLNWAEISQEKHRRLLDLYRAGLRLRKELFGFFNPSRDCWQVEADLTQVSIRYALAGKKVTVCFRLKSGDTPPPVGAIMLRSNAPEFAGDAHEGGPETFVIAQS